MGWQTREEAIAFYREKLAYHKRVINNEGGYELSALVSSVISLTNCASALSKQETCKELIHKGYSAISRRTLTLKFRRRK